MRRWFALSLKFAISLALIAYLAETARHDPSLAELWRQPKDWRWFAVAAAAASIAVLATFVRWGLLVRALGLPFSASDALRLGALGYVLNFFSLGSVGGDLFKAVAIAREHPGRKTAAVASVAVDRAVGLLGLFLVGAAGLLATGEWRSPSTEVRLMGWVTIGAAAVGLAAGAALVGRDYRRHPAALRLGQLRFSGRLWTQLFEALTLYRARRRVLVVSLVTSLAVHALWTLSVYAVALGLSGESPSLADHWAIVPLALATGVLPLPLGALGAFEGVLKFLYTAIPAGSTVAPSQGLVVAFGYRAITIALALASVAWWLASRRPATDDATVVAPAEVAPSAQAEEHAPLPPLAGRKWSSSRAHGLFGKRPATAPAQRSAERGS